MSKRLRAAARPVLLATILVLPVSDISAQTPPVPDAKQSDPVVLGYMQGFPPPPDKIIRFGDGSSSRFPMTRWAFSHIRELVPTSTVSRGEGPVVDP